MKRCQWFRLVIWGALGISVLAENGRPLSASESDMILSGANMNCSAYAAWVALYDFGIDERLEVLKSRLNTRPDQGVRIGKIVEVMSTYGVSTHVLECSTDEVQSLVGRGFSLTLLVDKNTHLLAVRKAENGGMTVIDALKKVQLSRADVASRWDGVVVAFEDARRPPDRTGGLFPIIAGVVGSVFMFVWVAGFFRSKARATYPKMKPQWDHGFWEAFKNKIKRLLRPRR